MLQTSKVTRWLAGVSVAMMFFTTINSVLGALQPAPTLSTTTVQAALAPAQSGSHAPAVATNTPTPHVNSV